MSTLRFKSLIGIRDGNPYVLVSAARAKRIKASRRKPLPVLLQINGRPETPWRINMMPTGSGDFYLYLHGDVRKASRTKVGDTVSVEVSFDAAYKNGPMHPMPAWFRIPLAKNRPAKKAWDAISPAVRKKSSAIFPGSSLWLPAPATSSGHCRFSPAKEAASWPGLGMSRVVRRS